ncbi:MAG: hypothetical protein M1817_003625 [Caeruleum heppii]|nr:MAG: hypothetical protein M1817_003625 [Caeruleum heppii]
MPSAPRKSRFKTLQTFETDFSPTTFTQYESDRTGMQVVVVDQKGPKVSGYFTLATEIHDDSGAPHTLEHLIFMGSKSYKYKGILDKLATRSYSNTNAWTATDHTAYTLDTAGWEGFAQILPVYLEHVLLPTLTDAGCYTEVHHIDGTGHDAGVVYSEMQGVQNTQSELMDLKARRLMYPENVGFRYETGGMLEKLRVLSPDRIRAFHREMYQPKNLCLVIIGEVDHEQLLHILDDFEKAIANDLPIPEQPWKRPWVESAPTPQLNNSIIETVEFPEEDESSGEILVSFLGPDINDTLLTAALSCLLVYLAGSSVSVLEHTIVEKEELASAVYYSTESRPDTVIQFVLSSVATEKLTEAEKRLFEVLHDTASRPFDMQYLLECVQRERRQVKYQTEASASIFSTSIISDFLFGRRDGSTLRDLQTLKEYDMLEAWSEEQWKDFLRRWVSHAPHISILGVPSAKLSAKLKADEKARVEEQKKRLGEEGLVRLEKRLAEAKAANDVEIPRSLLETFKIPGTESIHFISCTTARAGLAQKMGKLENPIQQIIDRESPDIPLFIHFEHIPTNFVHVTLLQNTDSIPVRMRPLLSIYLDNFFNTPILRNGTRIEFEQVVPELERDTVGYTADGGYYGNSELLRIRFQVELEKYDVAIRWLKEMLWSSVFDEMRVKAAVTKQLADIPEAKRDGNRMADAVTTMIHLTQASISRARGSLTKALYLKRLKKQLQTNPQSVLDQLESLRWTMCRPENFRILIIANVQKLKNPVSAWQSFITSPDLDMSQPLNPLDSRLSRLSEKGRNPGNSAYIVPLPTIDSSYSIHTTKGPDSFTHPRLPALLVALAYFDAVEGPLWCAVRGTGLAYGTSFSRDIESGHLELRVYRSPDAYKAFATARQVIRDHLSGAVEFSPPALDGAISSIVVGFADEQSNMNAAAQMSFINQVIRGVPKDYVANMLRLVRAVGVDEIRDVVRQVVMPVFEPARSNVVVTCAPIMEENLKTAFEKDGFPVEVQPLSHFQDDYGLQSPDGDADDDDGTETSPMEEEDDDEESESDDSEEGIDDGKGLY